MRGGWGSREERREPPWDAPGWEGPGRCRTTPAPGAGVQPAGPACVRPPQGADASEGPGAGQQGREWTTWNERDKAFTG